MEEFYPFRSENLQELQQLEQLGLRAKDHWRKEWKESAMSFLLPLVTHLLDNVEKSRALENTFQEKYGGDSDAKLCDGFWKIVEAYLEENNGTGNLLRITQVLRSNGHRWIAEDVEKFFLRYSVVEA